MYRNETKIFCVKLGHTNAVSCLAKYLVVAHPAMTSQATICNIIWLHVIMNFHSVSSTIFYDRESQLSTTEQNCCQKTNHLCLDG